MKDDVTPATKRDLRELETALKRDVRNVETALKRDVRKLEIALKRDVQNQFQEFEKRIRRHFEVVLEDYRHDLAGVNHDEIEAMKDRQRNHEQRIATLERSAGMVTH